MLIRIFSLSIALALLLTGTRARGQETAKTPVPLKVEHSKNLKCYYGVIGHIGKQGVFEFLAPCANLAELIERTGGLLKSATGNLKIVHSDGSEDRTFYSLHSQQKLLPNDILIVEGIADNSRHERQENQDESRTTKRIRIGLINMIDRPVVLKIRTDLATLDRLLGYLNQPPELAKTLQIVRPAGSPSRKNEEANPLLTEGSIVVFAPGSVTASSLPFHAAFEPAGVPQTLTHNTTASARSDTSNSQQLAATSRRNDLQPASRKDRDHRLTSLPPDWAKESAAGHRDPNQSHAEPAASNLAGESNLENSGFSSSRETVFGEIEPVEVISATKNSASPGKRNLSFSMFVTIVCILGSVMLFCGFLLWSISRKTRSIARSRQSKTKKRNYLKALIEDAVPVVTLEVPHPGNFKLFDHPSGEKFLRIDAAHRIRRPQFLPRESQPEEKQNEEKQNTETIPTLVRYDTIIPEEESLEHTVTVEPETRTLSNASDEKSHEVRAPHFLKKTHTPLTFQPHSQHNDYIQRVLQRVRQEERK